ncbi:FAD-dependent monooxygenase [Nocardioides convexus]|uniref:FAD-dependent monooxygenase n=1 Tax=Nocardioides convexus TaxID=2712224 RepID=UPI0024186BCE|nr:FAD-dependent monooxygenase [Nocardioides convexus]
MSEINVLVSGASIAGPALAHWLSRRGARVTVVEQAPGLRPGGQAVDARGVAKEVIRRMGLDTEVRAACTDTRGAYSVDADGNVLETHRADENDGDGYVSEIEILRGDLSQAPVRRHARRRRVRLRRPDHRGGPGRGRCRRGPRERWAPALRPRRRRRGTALGTAGDGLRPARAVRASPRAGAGVLHRAQRVRHRRMADRPPERRPVGGAAPERRSVHGDRDDVLPGLRGRHRPPRPHRAEAAEAGSCASRWRGSAGRPSGSSPTSTPARTSTSTRSPRW